MLAFAAPVPDRPVYPKPPIVEAVVDLRLVADVDAATLRAAVLARLGETYTEDGSIDQVTFSTTLGKDPVEATGERSVQAYLLRTGDKLRALGCGTRTLTAHVLAPYPGWQSFVEQIESAVAALPERVVAGGLAQLAVRYIDKIVLPPTESLEEYITVMPQRAESMPGNLQAFHDATQAADDDGTVVRLTLASGPAEGDRPVLIYDLNLHRKGEPLCESVHGWRAVADVLHARQREIFEGSITPRMRELFQ